jgi:hypothetical protein
MFLVEKDNTIEPNQTSFNNVTNLMNTNSIASLIDTDRHKFETFADALWWGIVCFIYFILFSNKFFVFCFL